MLAANLKNCADIQNRFSYYRRKNENNFFLGSVERPKKLFPIFRVMGAVSQAVLKSTISPP